MERVLLNIILVSSYLFCDTSEVYSKSSPINSYRHRRSENVSSYSCALPPAPENGRWLSSDQDKLGGKINKGDSIQIECNEGYKLSRNNSYFVCDENWNISRIPWCEKMCPGLNLGDEFNITCKNSEGEPISCAEATDSSTLSYKCPYGFKTPEGVKSTIQCLNGSWELPTPECQLEEDLRVTVKPELRMKVVCIYDSSSYYMGVKPADLDANLCTHVIFHYAGLSINGDVVTLNSSFRVDESKSLYDIVLDMKKIKSNLKVLLSISGLGINSGDEFPTVAADSSKRSRLVSSIKKLLEKYEFDGIDIHWRYPTAKVKKEYGVLLQELKEALGPHGKLLTATVYVAPTFLGYNISAMKANLDWINLKCYEHYTAFSQHTGQNSALYPSSTESAYEKDILNIAACGFNWNSYGIKKDKIVVGITFFGRYYTLKDKTRHGLGAPVSGSTNSNHTGLVSYSEICQNYTNWTRSWDDEQKNPYRYYEDKWVGYDDQDSIKLKVAFIKKNKYSGIAVFSIDADDVQGNCGEKQILLKQVYNGLV